MINKRVLLSVLTDIEEDIGYLYMEKESVKQEQEWFKKALSSETLKQEWIKPLIKQYKDSEKKINQLIRIKEEESEKTYEDFMKLLSRLRFKDKRARELLEMRYMNEKTFSEIAEKLCIGQPAVSKLHVKILESIPIEELEALNKDIVNVYM